MDNMDIYDQIDLQDCPFCRGAGLLEEENGWCWYVTCVDCGSNTAEIEYRCPEDRVTAAKQAAELWNLGKVLKSCQAD